MEIPEVSVIVVTYNSEETIQACLESLLSQTVLPREILVVDNASQDGSKDIVSKLPVRLIELSENVGFPAACNLGATTASGQVLGFVNPDAYLASDWLETLSTELMTRPKVAAVTGQIYLWGEQPRTGLLNAEGNETNFLGFAWCRKLGVPASEFEKVLPVPYPSGAAMIVRRAAFESVGGFDSDMFLYHDDVDLGLRLRLSGWEILMVPSAIAYHQYEFLRTPEKMFFLERNRLRVLVKVLTWKTWIRILPAFLLGEVVTLVGSLIRGWFHDKCRSYVSFLSQLPAALAERRVTQESRRISDDDLLPLLVGGIYHPYVVMSRFGPALNLMLEKYRSAIVLRS